MDLVNVIISGISAAVAVVSAVAAGVSALRSREAKRIAEEKRDEAVAAATKVASATDRIAAVQESRQIIESSAQASCIVIVLSEMQRGYSGWWVQNYSDQPVTDVVVRGTGGAQIVVYRGSGPESLREYPLHTLGARQHSKLAFRPTGVSAVHADPGEVERMALRFTDARGQIWERVGTQSPQPVV
ncbi:hypothetical protein [Mycobacteroides franklinii]|uniref:hypothetical protein n=1 Tax=Mycobacteroides franklinii TaxID=948102 RepID=UPI0013E8B05C|nr:hypothetical protein [Mycobacteroides franklinii]